MEDNISSTNNSDSNSNSNSNSDVFTENKIILGNGSEITLKKEFSLEYSSPEELSNSFHRESMPQTVSESITIRLSNSNAYTCELNKKALETLKTGDPIVFSVPNDTDHTILLDSEDNEIKVYRERSHTDCTLLDEYGKRVILSGEDASSPSPSPTRSNSPNTMVFSDDSNDSNDSDSSNSSVSSDESA